MEESDVIHAAADMWKEITDVLPALTVLLEAPLGANGAALVAVAAAAEGAYGDGAAVERIELRFVVEGIDVAGTAVHEQEDHALRLALEVRPAWGERIDEAARLIGGDT